MALTLPYFYRVDDVNTIAQPPINWVETGDTAGDSSIIAPPADVIAYTLPVTNVVHCDITSGKVNLSHQLPDSFSTTAGFRTAWWVKGEIDEQSDQLLLVSNAAQDDAARDQVYNYISLVGAEVGYTAVVNDGVSSSLQDMGSHASMGADHWFQIRTEWDFVNDTVETWVYQSSNGFNRSASTTLPFPGTWSPSIVNAEYMNITVPAPALYHDDFYVAAFWLGDLTDAWPAVIDVPASSGVKASQDPLGTLSVSGQTPVVFAGIDVVPKSIDDSTAGWLKITGFSPAVAGFPTNVYPGLGTLSITGYDPTVAGQLNTAVAQVPLGTLSITGYDPAVTLPTIAAPVGALTITGYNPTVAASASDVHLYIKFKDAAGNVWTREIGARPPVVEASATRIASSTDEIVIMDATGGDRTYTLPTLTGRNGFVYEVKKEDSSANTVTVAGTIDNDTNFILEFQDESVTVIGGDSSWWII